MGATTAATPWDVYREIHKAMRFALFGVTTQAGNTDAADDEAVRRLVDEWGDVRFVLLGHHSHENDFCDDLIKQHAPELREDLEAAHELADATIARLEATAGQLLGVAPEDRWGYLRSFYLDLADFTGTYIEHLRFEEDRVMPALNVALKNEQLETLTNNIRGSVRPPDMCIFIRYMVPSMNFSERLDMLGGMHAGAPPEIFEMFRAAAEACLDPADYRAVAAAGDFA